MLAVCTPPGVIAFLRQVVDITIEAARTEVQAQTLIGQQEWALFLLDHRGLAAGPESLLAKIRQCREGVQRPVVYCLGKGMDAELAKKLVGDFGVQTLLAYPHDRQEIAHHIAGLLGLTVKERADPKSGASARHEVATPGQPVDWDHVKSALKERVAILERTATFLLEEMLPNDVKEEAARQCCQLALDGSGYGLTEVSKLASEAEQLLRQDGGLLPPQVLRFCEVTVRLQEQTDALARLSAEEMTAANARPLVLVVCSDEGLPDLLRSDAPNHDLRILAAQSVDAATEAMATKHPNLVLLDIGGDGVSRDELEFVGDLAAHLPYPALGLTDG